LTLRPPQALERDPAARGSALLFWAQLAGNSGLFLALVVVTRALGPSGRGTIAFITVAAILLARVARLGVSEATTVFTAQRPAARPALLTNLVLSVGTSTTIGACLVCGALAFLPASVRPSGIGTDELVFLGL
jgi:O-antigen/teichoic acid export membrane protein